MRYVIQLKRGLWVAPWGGRTPRIAGAMVFTSPLTAEVAAGQFRAEFPAATVIPL